VVPRGVTRRRARRGRGALQSTPAALLAIACALFAGGCGGGTRQDAHEPKGTFALNVVHASFPSGQAIARPASLELSVRNTGNHTAPNVAVTIDSFDYTENYPELAADKRPIWVIEQGPGTIPSRPARSQAISPPGSGQTNYVNTWALGRLAPGSTRKFLWRVVPVKSGVRTVHYVVAAGLGGQARAVNVSGGPVQGQFTVDIAPAPPATHVNPSTGQVVPGQFPLTP
jgi:hypothetical protein